jgi:uncharacterized damage-inducible protein DinB
MGFLSQYEFIKSSRSVLLDYCSKISGPDFLKEHTHFGRGSVRNLLVHIGNTYEFWIGEQALDKQVNYLPYAAVTSVKEAADYLSTIDMLVNSFAEKYHENYMNDLRLSIGSKPVTASPLKLFTHVITHEFHHKGQILSISRHMGYTPVDTDIIR